MSEPQRIDRLLPTTSPVPSPKASPALALRRSGSCEISVFAGARASAAQIAASVHKLSAAFPQMPAVFFNLLAERIAKTGMTARRLDYAVNQVLDHFTYRQLTIADVVSADVKCRLLDYRQMCDEAAKRGASTDDYAPVWVGDAERPAWVLRVDKAQYGIPDRIG